MAKQVAARLSGDDYQHLFAWQFALELKMPNLKVKRIAVEQSDAGSFDDVTIEHETSSSLPDAFYQIKYHVDHRNQYSTQSLIAKRGAERSLLEKFFDTWKQLHRQNPDRRIELHLVSNWTWDSNDKIKTCINGRNNTLKPQFLSARSGSELGKLRDIWQNHLNTSHDELEQFVNCLHFRLGYDCTDELEKRISERMMFLGLKHDLSALLVAVGIVRDWIKTGRQNLTLDELEHVLKNYDLYLPKTDERSVVIYVMTIKDREFEIEPDYSLDWRELFEGSSYQKSHKITNPSDWNGRMLPELQALEARVNAETSCRFIKARGYSRLSVWFAFGFTFSEVAGYTLEVDQQGALWRTDAKSAKNFKLSITTAGGSAGEILDGTGDVVAVGISVTGSLENDVRKYLQRHDAAISAVLFLRPEQELGRGCIQSAEDAVALADQAKKIMREFVKKREAVRLLLFYYGPLSGAVFIGHRLNAVCREIQIMEDQQPGYAPSFLLT